MSKYNFLVNATKVNIIEKGMNISDSFPSGTYTLIFDPERGAWFEKVDEVIIDESSVYGNHINYADMFYKYFTIRDRNTGVLLTGLKGTGKTLISKVLAKRFQDDGRPVIIIDRPIPTTVIADSIGKIPTECLIVLDEFEKNYDRDAQNQLLSFLDGIHKTKHMVLVIANAFHKLTDYIINRPNRILFRKHFDGISVKELRDFLDDKIGDKNNKLYEDIINYHRLVSTLTYDIINNLIEVCLTSNLTFDEVKDILNIPEPSKYSVDYVATVTTSYNDALRHYSTLEQYDNDKSLTDNNVYSFTKDMLEDPDKRGVVYKTFISLDVEDCGKIIKRYLNKPETDINSICGKFNLTPEVLSSVSDSIWMGSDFSFTSETGALVEFRLKTEDDEESGLLDVLKEFTPLDLEVSESF